MRNYEEKSGILVCAVGQFIVLGTWFAKVYELVAALNQDGLAQALLYSDHEMLLIFAFLPTCLIPFLGLSLYYANKEKNKVIKIASVCLLVHHIICLVAALVQVL